MERRRGEQRALCDADRIATLLKSKGGGALGDLPVRQVIGAGESQSASFLTTYANAIDPIARIYDGFLIYSRFGGSAPLDGGSMVRPGPLQFVKMSSSLRVPTLVFETETDLLGPYGFYPARQPDTDRLRIWEVAGTSHVDAYMIDVSDVDSGTATYAVLAAAYAPRDTLFGAKLAEPYNNGPQNHYVVEAAIARLRQWAAGGKAPPHGQPIAMQAADLPFYPGFPLLDGNGNVLGGVHSRYFDGCQNVPRGTFCK